MRHPAVAVVVGVAIAVVLSVGTLELSAPPPHPWGVEQVLIPAGSTLHTPAFGVVRFDVPSIGGAIVGAAEVDNGSLIVGVLAVAPFHECPGTALNGTQAVHSIVSWLYSINESLAPGRYVWGALCGGIGNITVTHSIEVLYP